MEDKVSLKSDSLVIEVNTHGAELSRIFDTEKSREVLWNADKKYWARFAPVLFPMVGASFDGQYKFEGVTYKMGQHGFARDSEFMLESATDNECWYELTSSEETKKKYPFDFRLEIGHRVEGRKITVMWSVTNTGDKTMYYNIGAHPAFLIPEGLKMTDLSFDVPKKDTLKYIRIEDPGCGCAQPKRNGVLTKNEEGVIPVTDGFFSEGVYICEDNQIDEITLLADKMPYVKIVCEDFPYFGIWSKDTNPFVCLEPWQGRTDDYGFTKELKDKTGVRSLKAGDTEQFSYEIYIY